jgi:lysophospholipid acyltransferase (LPLAT)-like uncharacterized protein
MRLSRLVRSPAFEAAACRLVAAYIRLVHATSRWQVQGQEHPAAFWNQGRPFIAAFWHGRLLMMPLSWRRGVPIAVLISHHRDGERIARVITRFGLGTVRGSAATARGPKGGATALRAMLRHIEAGHCVGITPDGPRGPRERVAHGLVTLAQLSGTPVIPTAFAIRRHRRLGYWDRFLLALPFSRGVFVWGEPIMLARTAEPEAARRLIEDRLMAVTREADRCVMRPRRLPAREQAETP